MWAEIITLHEKNMIFKKTKAKRKSFLQLLHNFYDDLYTILACTVHSMIDALSRADLFAPNPEHKILFPHIYYTVYAF